SADAERHGNDGEGGEAGLLDELPKAEADILQKCFHKRARSLHCEMRRRHALDSGNFAKRTGTSGCFGGELSLGFSCFTFRKQRMPEEQKTKLRLEIAHVLFIDVVGYSKLLVKQQSELLLELNEIVSGTNECHEADSAGKLIRLPTGDGMALVFRTNPEAPAQCAMEIARALKSHPALQLRMGIHSGPVNEVADVNQRANIAGAGINLAQRVMDCGDAGHILLSKHVAEDLEQDERWRPLLHDLGTCEVKHGARVGVTTLYSDEVGN